MQHIVTTGIILGRTNFGESDRILTILTPDHGKIRVMAKGVRKITSKLAGGMELFCISTLTFIPGKNDIGTLVSTRLMTNYSLIPKDIGRTMAAYELLRFVNKSTYDNCEEAYYHLLTLGLEALNDEGLDTKLVEGWFCMQLLKLLGHQPNLETTVSGQKLKPGEAYQFDFENMTFFALQRGPYSDKHIKLLRLFLQKGPKQLSNIHDVSDLLPSCLKLVLMISKQFIQPR